MPNVVTGTRMSGLLVYLVGPGRANEHTEPHLVAGDPAVMAWHDDAELSYEAALSVARHLDRPHALYDVDVKDGHVWHCSLSLRSEEGQLSDAQWADIAHEFVAAMEFDDAGGVKAPCRWAAVRHGVSKNGNDHVHLLVDLVREDGTKASVWQSKKRAQTACRALEVKYGLEQLESAEKGRATRGVKPGELEAEARRVAKWKHERDRKEQPGVPSWDALTVAQRRALVEKEVPSVGARQRLAVRVRGAAAASVTEGEFVRRLRRTGVLVRPRFAAGTDDVVAGYSVAEKPVPGERPIWYGGGYVARDLTLPRLRTHWEDSPEGALEASQEWRAAWRGRRVVSPGREQLELTPEEVERRTREIDAYARRLRAVPMHDTRQWVSVARQTSGVLAAWSNATEATPGPLAGAARTLSVAAQTIRHDPALPHPAPVMSSAAPLVATIGRSGSSPAAQAVLIRAMLRFAQSVATAAEAEADARYAESVARDARVKLQSFRDTLPALEHQTRQPLMHGAEPEQNVDPDVQRVRAVLEMNRGYAAPSSPLPPKTADVPARRVPSHPSPRSEPER